MAAPNQTCATATAIPSVPFSVTVNTQGTGNSPTSPDSGCGSGNSYNSVWYRWLCPAGVTTVVGNVPSGGPNFGIVSVFSGVCGALVDEGLCAFQGAQGFVLPSVPGTTYFFLLTSFDPGGIPALTFVLQEPTTAPDACVDAVEIASLPFQGTFDTTGNGNSPSTPDDGCATGDSLNSAWLKWTAPAGVYALTITFDDHGDANEGIFSLFTGTDCGSLVYANFCGANQFDNFFEVTPGTTYYFLLTSFNAGGIAAQTLLLTVKLPAGQFCTFLACATPPPDPGTVQPIRRVRRFPLGFDRNLFLYISAIEFLIQPGQGLTTGQGSNPMIELRFSEDGGVSWGPIVPVEAGKLGEYLHRVVVNRIGKLRDGWCEIAVTDPIFWAMLACYIEADEQQGG